jgi:lipid-A-disaccharide synthase
MAQQNEQKRVFISAAEPSGDVHCAGLINSLHKAGHDIEFVGVGGRQMQAAGCRLLALTTDRAAMTYNAFWQVWYYFKLIRQITGYLKNNKIDLVIVCDSPAFNGHVAKAAKKNGIKKTLFYVAPQLWAWAPWRIYKLRKYCDRLACILPFEEQWFRSRGVQAQFVGNPLLDELALNPTANKKNYIDFDPAFAKIALMPGSRRAEINKLWPPMQQVALKIKEKWPGVRFTVVAVDEKAKTVLKEKQAGDFICEYTIASVLKTATEVDFAILASGSATLQVAAAACPMVIMYQTSRILWHLCGKALVRTRFLSLVNILADTGLVPEFMPYFGSAGPIADTCIELLDDKEKLRETSYKLAELVSPLAEGKACRKVGQIAMEMMAQNKHSIR